MAMFMSAPRAPPTRPVDFTHSFADVRSLTFVFGSLVGPSNTPPTKPVTDPQADTNGWSDAAGRTE